MPRLLYRREQFADVIVIEDVFWNSEVYSPEDFEALLEELFDFDFELEDHDFEIECTKYHPQQPITRVSAATMVVETTLTLR